jgi:hypothetical protein
LLAPNLRAIQQFNSSIFEGETKMKIAKIASGLVVLATLLVPTVQAKDITNPAPHKDITNPAPHKDITNPAPHRDITNPAPHLELV